MTLSATPPRFGATIPVWNTAGEVYATLWALRGRLLAIAVWPFILWLVQLGLYFGADHLDPTTLWPTATIILGLSLSIAGYTLFAVAWHREVLLRSGGESASPAAWSRRHLRFVGYLMAIFFLIFLAIVAAAVAAVLVAYLLGLDATVLTSPPTIVAGGIALIAMPWLIFARLGFVLPATAVGERYGFRDSWRNTRGNALRLVFLGLITTLPLTILSLAVIGYVEGADIIADMQAFGSEDPIATDAQWQDSVPFLVTYEFVLTVLYFLNTALGLAAISIPFRRATGWVPAND